MPCIKIHKPLVVYIFSNVVITTVITMLLIYCKILELCMPKNDFKGLLVSYDKYEYNKHIRLHLSVLFYLYNK